MNALLFGSISSLADTSEVQREAFNAAFAEHGLDWRWDRDDYRRQLQGSGGRDRIAEFARDRGEEVDADAVHATKSRLFQERLREQPVAARPGVVETIRAAREQGRQVGLVTTTSPENVEALLASVPDLGRDDFDVVVDATQVERPKPDPAAYALALERLGVDAGDAVAVEDNLGGLASARAAGVRVVAFPNANTADHDFADADLRTDELDLDRVTGAAA